MNATMTGRQEWALDEDRLRIWQDIHDDLGARLTEMVLLGDLAQRSGARANGLEVHIGRLSAIARDALGDISAIIWALNPYHDCTNSLAAYIFAYAKKHLGMTSIRFRLEALEEFPHCSLSSDLRHNLFLVAKAALNNIVKHSLASDAAVSLQSENSTVVLIIGDNGRGFSRADRCVCGHGLQNIETRARDIGGRFEIRSRSGQGTRMQVRLGVKTKRDRAHKRCRCRR